MLWYACNGIFCIAEASKAWVAKQWQSFYKHGYLSEREKWVKGGWNNVCTSNLCILWCRHKWSSADMVRKWNTIAFNGNHHIIKTKKGICHYTKCRQCFSFITRAFAHLEFLEWDQNMNQHSYLEILVWLQDAVRSEKTWTSACCLHLESWHFIRSWHAFVWEFLAKKLILKSDHPSCSPDYPLCDFWLFPNWKPLWRVIDFQTLPLFRDMWQPFWIEFQKRGSNTLLKRENTAWLSILLCRDVALRWQELLACKVMK